MSKENKQFNDYEDSDKKRMGTGAKVISIITVLLLLGGLVFAVFSFVDHSNRANERLNKQSTEEKKEGSKKKTIKRMSKRKSNRRKKHNKRSNKFHKRNKHLRQRNSHQRHNKSQENLPLRNGIHKRKILKSRLPKKIISLTRLKNQLRKKSLKKAIRETTIRRQRENLQVNNAQINHQHSNLLQIKMDNKINSVTVTNRTHHNQHLKRNKDKIIKLLI